jgi:hypothetical protein
VAWLAGLWDVLAAAGGSVALSFIVALALGLAALTIFFLGSSVVVLERFARAARSPLRIALFGVLWAAVMAAVFLDSVDPGASGQPWIEWLSGFGKLTLIGCGVMLVVVPVTGLLLRYVSGRRLAQASLVALGLGYALVVGGLGQPLYAAVPALLCGSFWLALGRLRRSRGWQVADAEQLMLPLLLALLVGLPVAFLLPGPEMALASAGSSLAALFAFFVLLGLLPLSAAGFLEMRRRPEWFIAVRYLVAKRRQTFISVSVADRHRALGHEWIRAPVARGDHREPRALHGAQWHGTLRGLRGRARAGGGDPGRGGGGALPRGRWDGARIGG